MRDSLPDYVSRDERPIAVNGAQAIHGQNPQVIFTHTRYLKYLTVSSSSGKQLFEIVYTNRLTGKNIASR